SWRQLRPAPAAGEGAFRGRRVVIFGGDAAAPLAGRLRGAGAEAVRVEPGAEFRDQGERLAVRPGAGGDYALLAAALRGRGWSGALHTLHLGSLEEPAAEMDGAAAEAGMERGFFSALRWVQAQAEAGFLGDGSTVLAATRGAHAVLGSEDLRPWQATLGALLKVVPQEYPQARARCVDVEEEGWEEAVLREAAQLLDGGEGPPETAWRGRRRWEPWFAALPADEPAPGGAPGLREGGVYLITGGLGGIGLTLARHLAERVRARLVLTGRRGLPPREGWSAGVAEQGEGEETSRRIRAVEALEAAGAEVLVLAADATDEDAMAAAVARTRARFGALHGVVHAAGVVPGGLIQLKTPESFAEVMAPKVAGTVALHRATDGIPLDFLLLCSSVHAIYGGIGSADHCAANTFLDAFAAWRSERAGRPTVSVNWDGWTEVGQAAGMTVSRRLGDLLRGPAATPTGHPLLGSRAERDGGWDYVAELGGATHWVLDEHRIGGTPTLPGTAYLEMARAAFADRVPGAAPL
ncbi:MAG TPA: SDR family oxidoreductase, partial [Longimicrobiaceae bacterium]|nr:SDR family oxidoreductase [Longimicrobiaceae bacterium]